MSQIEKKNSIQMWNDKSFVRGTEREANMAPSYRFVNYTANIYALETACWHLLRRLCSTI